MSNASSKGKRVYCEAEHDLADGTRLMCSKAKYHDAPATGPVDPEDLAHYDATARKSFGYPAHLVVAVEIPGYPEVRLPEALPDNYGDMTEEERRNYRHGREEDLQSRMNIYSEVIYAPLPQER